MFSAHRSDALTTELQERRGEPGHVLGSCMACVLLGSAMAKASCMVINKE